MMKKKDASNKGSKPMTGGKPPMVKLAKAPKPKGKVMKSKGKK